MAVDSDSVDSALLHPIVSGGQGVDGSPSPRGPSIGQTSPSVRILRRSHEAAPARIGQSVDVNRAAVQASDYRPVPRLTAQPKYADRTKPLRVAVTIDPACDAVMIPFASFVDRGMIRRARQGQVITTQISQEIDGVKRRFELKKDAFAGMLHRPAFKPNSLVDINSRSASHQQALHHSVDFEGGRPPAKEKRPSVPSRDP